jgi:hypothetical protein
MNPSGSEPELQYGGFDGKRAWEEARRIAFPRMVGQPGEYGAAKLIRDAFTRLGYHVENHVFPIPGTPWPYMRAGLALTLVLLLISGLVYPYSPWITVLCCALTLISPLFINHLWRRRVAGYHPSSSETFYSSSILAHDPARNPDRARAVYLLAHYDSKSQSLPIIWRIILVGVVIVGTAGLAVTGLVSGTYSPDGAVQSAVFWSAVFFCVTASAASALLFGMRTENRSPGGLDNAGGVGAILELAAALKNRPFRNIRPVFVATGAEELGLIGSSALAAKMEAECVDTDRVWILNLDGPGVPGSLSVIEGAHAFRTPESRFAVLIRNTAHDLRIPLRSSRMWPGFLLDHIPFSQKGFIATSLIGMSRQAWKAHTPQDTIERISPDGLHEAGQLIVEVLTRLDADIR